MYTSTQTCICTKMFKAVIFRWWQLSGILILFYTFLYITHTMRPWCQLVSENLISLKWPPLLPDASLTVLWDKVLCFFSRAPVGWPLQQLTLWQPLVPGCRWPLLPEPASATSLYLKGEDLTQLPQVCRMLPGAQARVLFPTVPLQYLHSNLSSNTYRLWVPQLAAYPLWAFVS